MSDYTVYSQYDLSGGFVGTEVFLVKRKAVTITLPLPTQEQAEVIAEALNKWASAQQPPEATP